MLTPFELLILGLGWRLEYVQTSEIQLRFAGLTRSASFLSFSDSEFSAYRRLSTPTLSALPRQLFAAVGVRPSAALTLASDDHAVLAVLLLRTGHRPAVSSLAHPL